MWQQISQSLSHLPQAATASTWWIAYSGGVDSHVLLHALHALQAELPDISLKAIHINHKLQPDADDWAEHCKSVCAAYDIELVIEALTIQQSIGHSLEAAAREARYGAIAKHMHDNDVLLTAHHLDDQTETILLQLLRGAGTRGLSGMTMLSRFQHGWLMRPLLQHSRAAILDYAYDCNLQWIDDSSNLNVAFDRNYVRHNVIPHLRARWPATDQMFARAAANLADATKCLNDLADIDLAEVDARQETFYGQQTFSISIEALDSFSDARKNNLVRHWLHAHGFETPDQTHLRRILREVVGAREDAQPCVHWHNVEIRRFQGRLYVMSLLKPVSVEWLSWDILRQPELSLNGGVLTCLPATQGGLDSEHLKESHVEIRFRQGGERAQPHGIHHTRQLKKLFQEAHIPTWIRDRIPLIYVDGKLAAVPGLWVFEPFACAKPGTGVDLHWHAMSD